MADSGSKIPHSASVSAELNAPQDVTLYHASGKSITVTAADEQFWLDQGFRRSVADPKAAVAELKPLFPEALDRLLEYVESVTSDGIIDPADGALKATAEYALRRLESTWGQLLRDIEALYPVKQGPTISMTMPDGKAVDVDPAQVAHYKAQGWKQV